MPKPTVDQRVAKASDKAAPVLQPPEGVALDTPEEELIWSQFVRARDRSDWREFDLILLAKIVKAEAQIRNYQKTLNRSGPIIENRRGTLVENPLLRVIDTLLRQQLAMIRSLSLTVTDGRAKNKGGQPAEDITPARNNIISLIAVGGSGIGEED